MKKLGSILAALMLVVAGCSQTSQDTTQTSQDSQSATFTLGLTYIPDVQFAPVYVAEKKGYFKEAGLNVTLRHHGAQENLFGALQSGDEDIVFAGGDEMMQARSTGIDVVNWATMYQKYPVVVISPKESRIGKWSDLAGKTIGLPGPYGENYFALLAGLEQHGLKGKVKTEFIGYTQAAALKEKKVDAVVGFANNDTVSLQNAGIDVTMFAVVDAGEPPLVGVGFGSLAENIRADEYAKFLAAVQRGVAYAGANPQETLDIVTGYVPSLKDTHQRALAQKVLQETIKLYGDGQNFGAQNPQTWTAMSAFMQSTGIIKKSVDAKDAYTETVLKKRNK
ncbi:NitT/TauT family transport system substrate-binding protein [Arcanobacterium pluranimalium]|uniref:ABC transporter substrate-binding protein n=1 Tax=Arcanobacterium pluranimalium TaxID=108028 RepID=UPI001957CC12|nr:ABC transporter substrate-binding protein [Arcanobacterium pluranimalium]MBM7825426.1 NitT/TauT family transport system substrate-binding protein [Arcanobacterium pluranimalium]